MKEWICIQVKHHEDLGVRIQSFQNSGWRLHTYTAAQIRPNEINHYLLFEKG